MKLLDKKEVFVSIKRKKFFFGSEELEKKSIKLSPLGNKCDFEKDVTLKNCPFTLSFHLHEPIR